MIYNFCRAEFLKFVLVLARDLKTWENCFLIRCSEGETSAKEPDREEWTVYMDRWVTGLSTNARSLVYPPVTWVSRDLALDQSEACILSRMKLKIYLRFQSLKYWITKRKSAWKQYVRLFDFPSFDPEMRSDIKIIVIATTLSNL